MTVRIAQTDDLDTCLALRRQVFIEEQGVSEAEEVDGLDGSALHLLAVDGTKPVGTARLLLKGETAKIGRVCVLHSARGTGLGAKLIQSALDVASARPGITRAVLGAQIQALGFYEKLGFVTFGPVYDDAGIDHRDMERIL
ncbi:GNAT family N-acetyltransferase [uncultured Roseobacter sp.]|uniref:GNAT family N-acetyltransferase n=1 Tax=uncultured Roseobacter sp. TaxID=114847 RepID=UPI002637D9A7|nr:GNAT family N-acetyltransferase [uncultured Roseobacter sp.]